LLGDDGANVQLTVSRKVATPGGIRAAICAITSSGITPGPLGILETRPSAAAPASIAIQASSRLRMQQIFTLGLHVARIGYPCMAIRPQFRGSSHAQSESRCG
jgi:hypothetical protein